MFDFPDFRKPLQANEKTIWPRGKVNVTFSAIFFPMRFIITTILLLFSCHLIQAQESMMANISYPFLEKLIETAKTNYPKAKNQDVKIDIALSEIKRAKLGYFEALSFSYLFNPANAASNPNSSILNGYRFGLVLNIGSLLQRPAYVKQTKQNLEVSKYERDAFLLNLEAIVKERYFTYIQTLTILRLVSNAALDVESMLKESRYKFEKGEEGLEGYNRVVLMYSNQLQVKFTSETAMLIAKGNLEELLGKKLEDIQ